MADELYIQIMRYVDEEMNPSERTAFEDSVKNNEELLKEVKAYSEIKALSRKLMQNIKDFDAMITDETVVEHKEMLDMIQQAREDWEKRNWIDELIEKALQTETGPEDPPDSLRMLFFNFRKKNYQRAILDSESVLMSGGDEHENVTGFYRQFYKGMSYMAIQDFKQAIPALETAIKQSPDEEWKSKAQWILALAHLKTNDTEKAEVLLKQIAKNEQASEEEEKAIEAINRLKT